MKRIIIGIVLIAFLFPLNLFSQIENVIVEKYYISDNNDATYNIGDSIPVGATTYRIFIDLAKGSKIKEIYGDQNHPIKIKSDSIFFNKVKDGQTVAVNFNKNRFKENTIALDSWLTIGQISESKKVTYFGIPKMFDTSASIIGGINNDLGLLSNSNILAGNPITQTDGMDTMNISLLPSDWYPLDDRLILFGDLDSTIFGSIVPGNSFESNNFYLGNSGTIGLNPELNQVIIAQLTTQGELSFELNLVVIDSTGIITKYVAIDNGNLDEDEKLSPYLKYPFECGCLDPDYLEYSNRFACNDQTLCKNKIVLGCMDAEACNYDSKANVNLESMCCYPGYCNDRDLAIICPDLSLEPIMFMYPNPAKDNISLKISATHTSKTSYVITNSIGTQLISKDLGVIPNQIIENIDISKFEIGTYNCKITVGNYTEIRTFIKE